MSNQRLRTKVNNINNSNLFTANQFEEKATRRCIVNESMQYRKRNNEEDMIVHVSDVGQMSTAYAMNH